MSRPRLRHLRSDRPTGSSRSAMPPGSLAAILPLPLLMGGCASDEDELDLAAPLALPA